MLLQDQLLSVSVLLIYYNLIFFVNILVSDDTSVEGFYLKDVVIPPNSSLKPLGPAEKIILAPNNAISFQSNENDSLDVVISYVDIV